MATPAITLGDVTPAHFDGIVRIERAAAAGSIVALTGGQALCEALDRGHWLVVATRGDEALGWIWFAVDLKAGESIGQVFRVAVVETHRRSGVGRALVEHARDVFVERGCTRVRLTIAGDDAGARAFFERVGFAVDAITMDLTL